MPQEQLRPRAGFLRLGHRDGRVDRVLVWAVAAGVAWLVLYAVLTAAGMRSPSLGRFVAEVLYLVPVAATVVLAAYAARRTHGRIRLAWRLLVISNALWFAGEVAWTIFAYTRPGGAPIPSVADIGYFLSYAVALPAILVGLGLGVVRRPRGLLDALLVAAALGAIGWQLVIGPRVPGSWDAAALTTFLYPVLSVSIVSILVAVMVSSRRPAQLSMIIAGAAFGIAAISDAGYTYLVSLHAYPNLSWLSLGWQGEAVLLCVAALVAARRSEGDERLSHAEHDMAILPVLLAFLAVSGLMLADLLSLGGPSDVTLALTVLLFLGVLLRQLIAIRDRTRLAEQLRTDAITDSLTELYNRRFFLEMLQVEARVAARQRTPLSLILLDLDRFKHVNDRYGHSVGDAVLVEAAHRLSGSLREGDLISRYGGEEFVCLLPATGEGEAMELAEHVRSTLSGTPVAVPGGPDDMVLTASLGVATAEPHPAQTPVDVNSLINAADGAVYRAKSRGRNCVAASMRLASPYADADADADADAELPAELVWLADRIDGAQGHWELAAAVSRWSAKTGARLGLDQPARHRTAAAARLHDIGKVGISQALLSMPDGPNAEECEEIRRHPVEGARLLVELGNRSDLAPLVAAHHERFDGLGYPYGLAGADIPLEARIIAVCDAWAMIRANRWSARNRTRSEAKEEITLGRGTRFDPVVVDAFIALVDEGLIEEPGPLSRS